MAQHWTQRSYDLEPYKTVVRNNPAELIFRILGLNGTGFLAAYLFQDPSFIYMLAVYNVLQVGFVVVLRVVAPKVPVWKAIGVYMLAFSVMSMILAAAIYLWIDKGTEGRVLSLLLIMATVLYTVALRMHEPVASRLEAGQVALTMLILAIYTAATEDMTSPAVSMVIGLLGCLIYFVMAVHSAIRGHETVVASQAVEVERARLEAIGRLAGGVAHDFNNLLTVIQGNLHLRRVIQREGGSLLEAERLVHEAEDAAERAARTTSHLLAYGRRTMLQVEVLDLSQVLEAVEPLLRRSLPANVQLQHATSAVPLWVKVDRAQVENVVLNLVINARDAMPDGGRLSLRVGTQPCAKNPDHARCHTVQIEDTGTGISPDNLAHVTEPYFTTKPVGAGSGLGLSMARGVMEQSGGKLEISSVVGHGTIVILSFPEAPAPTALEPVRSGQRSGVLDVVHDKAR
ncbi:sensor histidine kinase [Roseobacteraceae bacterium S113]